MKYKLKKINVIVTCFIIFTYLELVFRLFTSNEIFSMSLLYSSLYKIKSGNIKLESVFFAIFIYAFIFYQS